MRISSPERWWRAVAAPLVAAAIGWILSSSVRLGTTASAPGLPLAVRILVTSVAVGVGLCLAVLIGRSHLSVDDTGLADHRAFRVARLHWHQIARFEVARPHALWGGFCVAAICRDGTTVDLMSTRAYSRLPSARHLDELHRICWSLDAARPASAEH